MASLSGAADGFRLERVVRAVQQLYSEAAGATVKEWSASLAQFRKGSEQQRLKDVNDYFNSRLRFEDDQKLWGLPDYWATPVETLLKGGGDCEDYAIAKYFSLKYVGVPVTKLRITYVKARMATAAGTIIQAHMVLTYYPSPDAEPLVLDNLVGDIRPASKRPDLTPIFSFNSEGVWAPGATEPQPGGGSRLSRWNDVLEKMRNEGFE